MNPRTPGKTYAEQGLALPPARDENKTTPPARRASWLGPRFEPANISASATMQTVQAAIRDAENGDPTSLFRFYRDSLLGDEHIQGELNKRKLAVIGQPMSVLPEDKENPDDVATAAGILRAVNDCENWTAALSNLLSASQWPLAVCENIFKPADAQPVTFKIGAAQKTFALQYTLKRIEPVNPLLFCFRHAYLVGGVGLGTATPVQQAGLMRDAQLGAGVVGTSPWYSINLDDWEPFVRLWPTDAAGRIIYDASQAAKLDPTRHVLHRGHLMTDLRDNWGGPMRAILAWWLLRGLGRDYFGRFMERYGSPFPVGKTNAQDPQAVKILQDAFSLATRIGGLVIGQEDQVELQSAMVQGGAEGHKLWHDVCNDAISFHITGIKPSHSPGGLNAGQSTQSENIREDVRVFDQKALAETLLRQPFERFKQFNGLTGNVRLIWGGLSEDDAATFATLLKTMSDAGFEPTDEAMPVVEEKTGIQWQRKVAAPSTFAPGAGFGLPGSPARAASGDPENPDKSKDPTEDTDPKTLTARLPGKLKLLSSLRAPQEPDAVEALITARKAALAQTYKGVMAPFRQAIEDSTSREDLERRLKTLYADWSPDRLRTEIEGALQLAAAAGAVQAKK